jgi:hypothetical protein
MHSTFKCNQFPTPEAAKDFINQFTDFGYELYQVNPVPVSGAGVFTFIGALQWLCTVMTLPRTQVCDSITRMKNLSTGRTYYANRVIKGDPCALCGRVTQGRRSTSGARGTLDHIHPRSCGGSNHWSNLANTCSTCNNAKGSYSLLGYLLISGMPKAERKRLRKEGLHPHISFASSSTKGFELNRRWYYPLTDLLNG